MVSRLFPIHTVIHRSPSKGSTNIAAILDNMGTRHISTENNAKVLSLQRNLQDAGLVCGPISPGWWFTSSVVGDSTVAALNTGWEPFSNFVENRKSRCRGNHRFVCRWHC